MTSRTRWRPALLAALCAAAAACVSEPSPPASQVQYSEAASPARGRVYAEETCAACHAIGAGEAASPNPLAPPFSEIANTPGMTGIALGVWLQSSHPNMPDLIVGPDHAEDLWAYISTLRDRT